MEIDREKLLAQLQSVTSGLARREIIEQSTYFIFIDGMVRTYNDEVACSCECDVGLEGAVPAVPLVPLLKSWPAKSVKMLKKDGNLHLRQGRRRSTISMPSGICLPVDLVGIPKKWRKLPKSFSDAVKVVAPCAGTDASKFVLMCIHIHPDYIEAADNFQVCRYPMKTGVKEPVVIRRDSLVAILGMEVTRFAEDPNWVHFRNTDGVSIACRRQENKYPTGGVTKALDMEGSLVEMPKDMGEILARCEIFSKDNVVNLVTVKMKGSVARILGEDRNGSRFEEECEVDYGGPLIEFKMNPSLLLEISKRSNECILSDKMMKARVSEFEYAACLLRNE